MAYLAAEGEKIKKKKKVGKPIGDPVRGRDAPMNNMVHNQNIPNFDLLN